MAVRFGSPPAGAEEAAAAGLTEVARGGMLKTSGGASLATTAAEQVSLVAPHEMRSLRLDAAAAHRGLEEAEHAGWRYLVQSAGIPVASAQLAPEAGGEGTALSQVNEGPFVQATAAALEQAQTLPQVADGEYEARMLTIPAIYVAALWLKDLSGDEDLVVPLSPAPSYLEAGRAYAEREFLDLVAGPAEERLAFDDSPQGTEGGAGG